MVMVVAKYWVIQDSCKEQSCCAACRSLAISIKLLCLQTKLKDPIIGDYEINLGRHRQTSYLIVIAIGGILFPFGSLITLPQQSGLCSSGPKGEVGCIVAGIWDGASPL